MLWTLCPHLHEPVCFCRPWELLLCSSCAAEGTHRRCSGLRNSITSWECDGCAGLGTCKRQSTLLTLGLVSLGMAVGAQGGFGGTCQLQEGWRHCSGLSCPRSGVALTFLLPLTATRDESGLAGVSVARQPGLEPCDGSREPATISPNTGNLVLSGLSPSSAPLETVSPSTSTQVPAPASSAPQTSKRRTNRQATSEQPLQSPSQGTGSSSPDSQITSGSSQSSFTETEDSSCSSSRGPDRRQNHPRRQRRAQTAHFRSRSPLDRTHVTAPSPGRRRTRQRPSGTSRRRNRSRLQRQTPDPSGRSRSPLDRNCTPAPSAGRRNSRETAARTSQRQQHCRRQRRTSNSSNRSRSPHDRSRVRAPSTARRTHRWDGETGTHR
ncbi:serine/arginine repetitive matrix protein 2-like isoform X1 [Manacus candei]|uniref:serine/arginine repetitive matrix protein 2-like isoform X1 n=1 Tax=Manacus candei TaxID=415023 RepID=UPI002226C8CB|nr:serine/arginine repetitive matrix protein 2-like isoform X1 [Manacus candei]XP_051652129.1 serine/arginine repetitive matrix protein 2-like isoform X1 [Manacus candei]